MGIVRVLVMCFGVKRGICEGRKLSGLNEGVSLLIEEDLWMCWGLMEGFRVRVG